MIQNFKPFNLTMCNKIHNRKRTLAGETIFYDTYFEPKNITKQDGNLAIQEFKHPSNNTNKTFGNIMIEIALEEFFNTYNIKEFDVIGGIHSHSKVVKKILNIIKKKYPNTFIINELILKTRMRNTYINQALIDHESSLKTKEKVPISLNLSKKLHYDIVSKASLFPTRFRRYVHGLVKVNDNYIKDITNKRVLLIDDTFGEGLTLCESSRLLKPYIKSLRCFTVMKDFCNVVKK